MSSNSVLGTAALRRLKKKKQKEREQESYSNQKFTKSQSVPGKNNIRNYCNSLPFF
jgi:hypothetical protein